MIARELIDEINKVDVVSFDVFDTLISRLCLEPRDVFFFAATKFIKETRLPLFPSTIAKYRELAESECRKKKAEGEVTLDEIYLKLNEALHLSENELASLKNSEIATEYAVTVSLDDRKEILLYALEKRKEVILVSDMYLPKLVIMSLLERNSYPVSKLKLYVSSEINKTKRDGTIFKYISERINGKEGEGKKFLHIGDSYESDIVRAKESGWLAWGVPNLNEQFLANSVKSSPLVRFKLNYSYSASILGGIFSKTQKSNDCFSDGSIEGLGYYCLGPLLYGFLEWLSERLVEKPVDKVLFLARDGYIMEKVFNKISPSSQCSYFYCSRRALIYPLVHKLKSTSFLGTLNFDGTLKKFIEQQLGFDITDELKSRLGSSINLDDRYCNDYNGAGKLSRIIKILENDIYDRAEKEYRAFTEYARQLIGQSKIVAIVDHGCSGTIAYYLNLLLEDFKVKLIAYNVLLNFNSRNYYIVPHGLTITGYYDEVVGSPHAQTLFSHLPLMEMLFSSPEPQLLRYRLSSQGECELLLDETVSNEKRGCFYRELLTGVERFVDDYIAAINKLSSFFRIRMPSSLACELMVNYLRRPSRQDVYLWSGLYFENRFSGWDDLNILENKQFLKFWPESQSCRVGESHKRTKFESILKRVDYLLIKYLISRFYDADKINRLRVKLLEIDSASSQPVSDRIRILLSYVSIRMR